MTKIEELLLSFLQQLIISNNIKIIYKDRPFIVSIKVENESYFLILEKEDGCVLSDAFDGNVDLFLEGSEKVIATLINGKERLQRLQKRGDLKVEGNFAAILKAETIFYLIRCDCCSLKIPNEKIEKLN